MYTFPKFTCFLTTSSGKGTKTYKLWLHGVKLAPYAFLPGFLSLNDLTSVNTSSSKSEGELALQA